MRERIYQIIEVASEKDKMSKLYDCFMIITIMISAIPLTMKNVSHTWIVIEKICMVIFIIDYLMRLITADYKYRKSEKVIAFIRYPFSLLAIIDLLSILPYIAHINQGFKLLRLFRLISALRVFRVFKTMRYSKNFRIIKSILKKSRSSLIAVGTLAVAYILISAIIAFNVEPETFETFFDAVYWATVSLATVGYGDIYPVTTIGRIITMISSVFGIAIIALPSSILTAEYLNAVSRVSRGRGS